MSKPDKDNHPEDRSLVPRPGGELAKAGEEVKSGGLVKRGLRDLEKAGGPKLLTMLTGGGEEPEVHSGSLALGGPNFWGWHWRWCLDGIKVASDGSASGVTVWDALNGRELYSLANSWAPVAWSPDGTKLATSGIGEFYFDHRLLGEKLAGGIDPTVRLWDGASGDKLHTLKGRGRIGNIAWSPDGYRIAICHHQESKGEVRIWDTTSGSEILTLFHYVETVVWSPSGSLFVFIVDSTARVWDAASGLELFRIDGCEELHSAVWSPDGGQLAIVDEDGSVRIWDIKKGTEAHTLKGQDPHMNIAWSPDGSRFLSVGRDSLRVWDTVNGKEIHELEGHKSLVFSIAWNPAGTKIASGHEDGTVMVWDAESGRAIHVIQGQRGSVNDIAWRPDGSMIGGSNDMTVRVWDAASGSDLYVLSPLPPSVSELRHLRGVNGFEWSPDGTKLVGQGWCYENNLAIWSIPK